MHKQLAFYFDFGSPTSYLAYTQLKKFPDQYDVEILFEPMLLGAVLKATNNMAPATVPAKGKYLIKHDLPRYVKRYQIQFTMNSHFPINTLILMRGCFAARQMGCFDHYVEQMFQAMWVENLNLGDVETLRNRLSEAGIDGDQLLALCETDNVKDALKAHTQAAIEKGIFGAPTLFLDNDMFFGQDRLDFVEERLKAPQ